MRFPSLFEILQGYCLPRVGVFKQALFFRLTVENSHCLKVFLTALKLNHQPLSLKMNAIKNMGRVENHSIIPKWQVLSGGCQPRIPMT